MLYMYCLAIIKYRFEMIKKNFRLVLFTIKLFHYKGNTFILLFMISYYEKNNASQKKYPIHFKN